MNRSEPDRDKLRALLSVALRKRKSRVRKRRGVALILVLGAIVILTVFVTSLQESTSATLSAALADRDSVRAEYNARGAVNLARLLVGSEPTVRRTVLPVLSALTGGKAPLKQLPIWEFSDMILGGFNDPTHAQQFSQSANVDVTASKSMGLTNGSFELKIVDEDSKINVNAAVAGDPFSRNRLGTEFLQLIAPEQYQPLFEQPDLDSQYSDRASICGEIIDWSDYDENKYGCDPFAQNAQNDGSEDNYYSSIGLPYLRKNAPYDSLDEIRQVRGVGDDFWSTFVDPDPNDPKQRVITVWGQSQININTANAQTLLAIVCAGAPDAKLCTDTDQMASFLSGVTLAKSFLGGIPLFSSPKQFTSVMQGKGNSAVASIFQSMGVDPVVFRSVKDVQKSVTTESKVFSIYAEGVIPGRNKETRIRIHSVVDFRNAAELGSTSDGTNGLGGQLGGSSTGTGSTGTGKSTSKTSTSSKSKTSSSSSDSAPASDADTLAALLSDPAGNTIYYRIE